MTSIIMMVLCAVNIGIAIMQQNWTALFGWTTALVAYIALSQYRKD